MRDTETQAGDWPELTMMVKAAQAAEVAIGPGQRQVWQHTLEALHDVHVTVRRGPPELSVVSYLERPPAPVEDARIHQKWRALGRAATHRPSLWTPLPLATSAIRYGLAQGELLALDQPDTRDLDSWLRWGFAYSQVQAEKARLPDEMRDFDAYWTAHGRLTRTAGSIIPRGSLGVTGRRLAQSLAEVITARETSQ